MQSVAEYRQMPLNHLAAWLGGKNIWSLNGICVSINFYVSQFLPQYALLSARWSLITVMFTNGKIVYFCKSIQPGMLDLCEQMFYEKQNFFF